MNIPLNMESMTIHIDIVFDEHECSIKLPFIINWTDDCFKISPELANEVLQAADAVGKWCKEMENIVELIISFNRSIIC